MSAEDTKTRSLSGWTRQIEPRWGIALLVAVHLGITFLQSWPLPQQLDHWFGRSPYGVWDILVSASGAILLAQLSLIAAYVALGSGRWWGRTIRGALLLLWLELAHMAGTRWLDSGRDSLGFEESIGTTAWNFAFLLLPLLLYRLFARRQIVLPGTAPAVRMQFRILHLLLVTTEAAALLAAIRAFVAENDQWRDELWRALRDYPFEFASYDLIALALLAAIPAVLVTLRWRSLWRAATVLLIWELLLSVGFVGYRALFPDLDPQFPLPSSHETSWMLGLSWLSVAAFCLAVAYTVWLTLAIVRRLGYDFLPVRRGGRQSSEATSAA